MCIKFPFQWLQKYRCCFLMCWTASDEFVSIVEICRVLVLWLRSILISSSVNRFFTSFIERAVGWWIVVLLECRVRTSSGTFLSRGQDKVISGIEQRIADFTFIPLGMSSPNHYYTASVLRNQIDWWSCVMLPCKRSLFVPSFKVFLILHIFSIATHPVQSKVRGCKSCSTKWVKSTSLTMTTFMTFTIQRMVVSELQLYLCTCRWSPLSPKFLVLCYVWHMFIPSGHVCKAITTLLLCGRPTPLYLEVFMILLHFLHYPCNSVVSQYLNQIMVGLWWAVLM